MSFAVQPAAPARPNRCQLFGPGSRPQIFEKMAASAADVINLDLEDAVAPGEKDAARDLVCEAVHQGGYAPREVIVRINGLDTPWGDADLNAAATSGADAILVPKVESAAMVRDVRARMKAVGAPDGMTIWAMMETPLGMLNAAEIAASSDRLAVLVMGTNDLVKDLGAAHTDTRLPVITALGLCMLAARAHGLAILDGVYNAFKDDEGLKAACAQGVEMGFDGKTLIHPAQLEITNSAFAPSPEAIALAERHVAAFAKAEADGKGIAVVDGQIVENLHVEMARALLEKARMIREMEEAA